MAETTAPAVIYSAVFQVVGYHLLPRAGWASVDNPDPDTLEKDLRDYAIKMLIKDHPRVTPEDVHVVDFTWTFMPEVEIPDVDPSPGNPMEGDN